MITIEHLESLKGKRVLYTSADKSLCVGGELSFFGINENVLAWGFQLTLDRMPITRVDLLKDSIIEIKENTIVTKALM